MKSILSLDRNKPGARAYVTACRFSSIPMPLTKVLERVVRLIQDSNETSSQTSNGRAQEQQRDESSMADFVRILQDHDRRSRW